MNTSVEPHVLIVSTKIDIATDAVVKVLARRSVRCSRLNTEDFPFDNLLTTRFENTLERCSIAFEPRPGEDVSFDDVSSLWYRRVRTPEAPDDMPPGVYDFCIREAQDALLGIFLSLPVRVMSAPDRIWAAEHKIFQLATARSLGLPIPETIITNNPAEVTRAFSRFHRQLIAKPVKAGLIKTDGEQRAIYTSAVLEEHLLSPAYYSDSAAWCQNDRISGGRRRMRRRARQA